MNGAVGHRAVRRANTIESGAGAAGGRCACRGTSPEDIEKAEDREFFKRLADRVGVKQPANGTATDLAGALAIARRIGFPVLVRPSFVLGGRAMAIVYTEAFFAKFCAEAFAASEGRPVLIDKFLEDAVEVDVDCLADGELEVIGGVMEHIEMAGIHSGDSACMLPPQGDRGDGGTSGNYAGAGAGTNCAG